MTTVAKTKKKLTITLDADVYSGLHKKIGRGNIGNFLNKLAKIYVVTNELEVGYRAMAADASYGQETGEWLENLAALPDSENTWA